MNEEQRIKLMEEDLKILKNEVKTILLDIREQYLNIQNPFNLSMVANTPPAGASPDQKEKQPETPAQEPDMPKDNVAPSPYIDTANSDISFGNPFADLTPKVDTEKPGLPGLAAMMDDAPGMGFSSGAGMAPEAGTACEPEEEEQIQKIKSPRNKKKTIVSIEADDTDENSFEENSGNDDINAKSGGPKEEEEITLKGKNSRGKKKTSPIVEAEDGDENGSEENNGHDDLANTKPVTPKNGKKKSNLFISGTRADLVIIAGLTQWIDQATLKLGKDRTEVLVEMSTAMGRIPDNMKDVLIRMIRISRYESASSQSPTATDYLATLAQLESLMGGEQIQDNALLSILSMMKESNRG